MGCKKRLLPRNLKLTIVGDKRIGKTCLLKTYCTGSFPKGGYVSTVFPYISDEDYVYSKPIAYAGSNMMLSMWDRVYNWAEDDLIRSLQYEQTDILLLCFSVDDSTSFYNAITVWHAEIQRHCPKTPFILVGLKKDLRESCQSKNGLVVTRSMGATMAQKIGAVAYLECSSKRRENIKQTFAIAVQTAMNSPPPKPKKSDEHICGSKLLRFMRLL